MAKSPIFLEIHSELPREGPGDSESTKKAFSLVKKFLPKEPNILDVGCGPGAQTIVLAQISEGSITALDSRQSFLDELNKKSKKAGLDSKITTVLGSMFEMNFSEKSFDLVWAEGAIFIIGFEEGLKEWKKFLKTEGCIVVSHLSWIKDNIPETPRKFWTEKMPSIRTIEENLKILNKLGYQEISHFILPESAWWNAYYRPLENRLNTLKTKYIGNPEVLAKINDTQTEIDLYKEFSDYYGYVFYMAKLN